MTEVLMGIVLSWLLEPLRPSLMRLIYSSADKLIVFNALFLIFAVGIEGAPILGHEIVDIFVSIKFAAFYSMLMFSSSPTLRTAAAYIPLILFLWLIGMAHHLGLATPFQTSTLAFPLLVLLTCFVCHPFLLFGKKWRGDET